MLYQHNSTTESICNCEIGVKIMKFSDLVNKPKIENTDKSLGTKPLQIQQAEPVKKPVKATKKNLAKYSIMDILRASNIKIKNINPGNNVIAIELYSIPENIDIILRDIDYNIIGNSIVVEI